MGMFDYFKCEYALPDYPFLTPFDLQTKDLDNEMKTFTLKKEGQLWDSNENDIGGEAISKHTGWVNAYIYEIVTKDFKKQNGYTKGEVNYCLNFDFRFEFSRGQLLSLKDDSFCSVREWCDGMFREIKRLTIEEFIALSQSKGGE